MGKKYTNRGLYWHAYGIQVKRLQKNLDPIVYMVVDHYRSIDTSERVITSSHHVPPISRLVVITHIDESMVH